MEGLLSLFAAPTELLSFSAPLAAEQNVDELKPDRPAGRPRNATVHSAVSVLCWSRAPSSRPCGISPSIFPQPARAMASVDKLADRLDTATVTAPAAGELDVPPAPEASAAANATDEKPAEGDKSAEGSSSVYPSPPLLRATLYSH